MKRTEKEEMVSSLTNLFNTSQVGILADYRGLTVAEVTDLRRQLREASTNMRVLKNRIAKIAIKNTPFEPLEGDLVDTRAFIYGDEPVGPARVVSKFQGSNDNFSVLKGLMITKGEVSLLDPAQIKLLGSLPSREELIAKLLSVLNGPLAGMLTTMNEIPAKFVRTLAALGQQKGDG